MNKTDKIVVGISLGDLNGVGIEVVLKTFEDKRMLEFCTPILFGSSKAISAHKKVLGIETNIHGIHSIDQIIHGKINLLNIWKEEANIEIGNATKTGGEYAFKSLNEATKALKEGNELIKADPEIFKLNSLMTDEIILSGEFYVDVPKAVNEAINGFVKLEGEFKVPGDYAFSRTEPLSEIILRAGGITTTAYPLGAVLERKSIKAQEKESNNILAAQL